MTVWYTRWQLSSRGISFTDQRPQISTKVVMTCKHPWLQLPALGVRATNNSCSLGTCLCLVGRKIGISTLTLILLQDRDELQDRDRTGTGQDRVINCLWVNKQTFQDGLDLLHPLLPVVLAAHVKARWHVLKNAFSPPAKKTNDSCCFGQPP